MWNLCIGTGLHPEEDVELNFPRCGSKSKALMGSAYTGTEESTFRNPIYKRRTRKSGVALRI